MNSMNDERFFDLAMKAIARQASDTQRAELDALLARHPELIPQTQDVRAVLEFCLQPHDVSPGSQAGK